ncbi:MAG TPA: hypothetical protein VIY73_16930 [Polyangiaceae bacterium]
MKSAFLAIALAASVGLLGCDKKSDAPASSTSTPAATAATAGCPAGSSPDGVNCKAGGRARLATVTWSGAFGDTAQALSVKNLSGATLKGGTIALWFYDRTGRRLDIAGAKKYATPGDGFGTTFKPGETKNVHVPLSKSGLPDGTAMVEGEVVKAIVVNTDGSDGPTWHNDDLNADDRTMVAAPSAAAPVLTGGTAPPATTAARPLTTRLPPVAPPTAPKHR